MKFLEKYLDKGLSAISLQRKSGFEEEVADKKEVIKDVKKTGTYQRLFNIIIEEALSSLPRDVTTVLGYDFVSPFHDALLHMRKEGISYCIYSHGRLFFDEKIQVIENKAYKNSPDFDNRFTFKFHDEIFPYKEVIIFGDLLNHGKNKFKINKYQEKSILYYENILLKLYPKIDDAHAWIFRLQGYNDIKSLSNNEEKNLLNAKIKKLARREASSIAILDKEDEFSNTQLNLDWIDKFTHIYQTKICVDNNIPFTKLFGEGATGLNATGEGDRKSWYDTVRSFQIINLFSQLKKYSEIVGLSEEFAGIVMEELDVTDRQANALIDTQRIQTIISTVSTGLLEYEDAKKIVSEIFGINKENEEENKQLDLREYIGVKENE